MLERLLAAGASVLDVPRRVAAVCTVQLILKAFLTSLQGKAAYSRAVGLGLEVRYSCFQSTSEAVQDWGSVLQRCWKHAIVLTQAHAMSDAQAI